MSRREDSLSLELYITLACLTGIVGVILVALAVFPDVDLGMRILRVATGLPLLFAFQHATRVSVQRLRTRRTTLRLHHHPGRLDEDVLALLRAGRSLAAIRLYRDVMGVGLVEAKRQVELIARESRAGDVSHQGKE